MKFEKDHDPDPIRRKFQAVDSINDLPMEFKQKCGENYTNLLKNCQLLLNTVEEQRSEEPPGVNSSWASGEDAIIRYMALLQTQITDIQKDSQNIWKTIVDLTQFTHELMERLDDVDS
jgi:hypothetical protein